MICVHILFWALGLPYGSDGKESACNVGDAGLIPGWGRFPGEGNGNPFQYSYSCLENPMDRGAWWATVRWGHKESKTSERLIEALPHLPGTAQVELRLGSFWEPQVNHH